MYVYMYVTILEGGLYGRVWREEKEKKKYIIIL